MKKKEERNQTRRNKCALKAVNTIDINKALKANKQKTKANKREPNNRTAQTRIQVKSCCYCEWLARFLLL